MAGTWRFSIDRIEGVGRTNVVDGMKNMIRAFDKREEDEGAVKQVVVEVSTDAKHVQRTKPLDLSENGNVRVNRVLFVPAPASGECVTVRLLKQGKLPSKPVGEATITEAAGNMQVEFVKKGRSRAVMFLTVTSGLPRATSGLSESVGMPLRPPSSAVEGYAAGPPSPHSLHSGACASPRSMQSGSHHAPSLPSGPAGRSHLAPPPGSVPKMPSQTPSESSRVDNSRLYQESIRSSPTAGAAACMQQSAHMQEGESHSLPEAVIPGMWAQSLSVPEEGSRGQHSSNQATALASMIAAGGGPSGRPQHAGRRPLRMRNPELPRVGTCDVKLARVGDLGGLQRPYLVVGLEGQEFRADDVADRGDPGRLGGVRYQFEIGSLQSNLQIYIYQDVQGPHYVVGRILVPLTDVLWPVGRAPDRRRLKSGFSKEEKYEGTYLLRFLAPSAGGDGSMDPSFLDSYGPAAIEGARKLGFGCVELHIEVNLLPAIQPLLAFYGASIVASAQRAAQLGEADGGPSRLNRLRGKHRLGRPAGFGEGDGREVSAAEATLQSVDFRSVLRSLERMRHCASQGSTGIPRWLRESPVHGLAAGVGWFLFCILGFFPCSLWLVPLYAWILVVVNGLLATKQREKDWASGAKDPQQPPLFWRDEACSDVCGAPQAGGAINFAYVARCRQTLSEVEPLLLTDVAFWERIRNALSFVDGAASSACFVGLGLVALLLSLLLLLLTFMDPGLSFFCGLYGAAAMVSFSRSQPQASREPFWWQWAINETLACVPDDAQVAHRYVSTQLQRVTNVREVV